jgi:8-oxo-dGTP diphosphatase
VREETGLALHSVRFRGVVSLAAEGSEHETLAFYFMSDDFSGEPVPSDEGALEWCGIDESFHKRGISDYYLRISPYVFREGQSFLGSARINKNGEIESLDIV